MVVYGHKGQELYQEQYENAKFYKDKNCCWIFDEKNLDKKRLFTKLNNIVLNKKEFKSKKKSIIKLNKKINWSKQNKLIHKEFNNED